MVCLSCFLDSKCTTPAEDACRSGNESCVSRYVVIKTSNTSYIEFTSERRKKRRVIISANSSTIQRHRSASPCTVTTKIIR